jgi:hypothetical protein
LDLYLNKIPNPTARWYHLPLCVNASYWQQDSAEASRFKVPLIRTAAIDTANLVKLNDINIFLSDTAWAICSTYHTVLKASPGAEIFGQDMPFNISYIADRDKKLKKIGNN